MSQCRHGNQQHQCAECTREMMPAQEALKAAMRSGIDLFAPDRVDDYLLQVREERDRYRRALDFVMRSDNLDKIKGYVAEALNPTPIND